MKVKLNGETREVQAIDVAELIRELGLAPEISLVEHNGTALRRTEWPERQLGEGDRVEIIRIVAGG
jgi:thiamine biosynthesis protein ThiS